jgi:Tfp pilus assembly protein PilV
MDHRKQKPGKPFRKMQGDTLLEVLVSLLIFSCGMLAIAGFQAESFKNTGDVQYRAEAIHLVNAYVGKMKAMTPVAAAGGASDSAFQARFHSGNEFDLFEQELATKLPRPGTPTVSFSTTCATAALPPEASCVDITVTWQPPGQKDADGNEATYRYRQTSVIGNN